MAGYKGFSLESDGSSLKQVDTTSGNRKSNKNNYNGSGRSFGSQNKDVSSVNNKSNGGNSSNGARLGGTLAREAENKVEEKNKSHSTGDGRSFGSQNKSSEGNNQVNGVGSTLGGALAKEAKEEIDKVNETREDETKTQDDTVYSSQNEWLLSFLDINSNNKGSIREISDEERKIIIDKMEKYWRNNLGRGLSVEYLVNGAVMRCACGKTLFNIVGKDHKVYTDSTEQLAMLNDTDKRLSSGCEMCDYIGYSYAYEDLEWVEKSNIEIGDNNSKALTMNSYMLSTLKQVSNKLETSKHFVNYFNKYKSSESETMAKELENKSKEAENRRLQAQGKPGIIKPVTSGQEFTIGSKLFIYPKFISDIHSDKDAFDTYWATHDFSENCNIDSGVVKRLMTRNFERMSDTEKIWIYRLANFFILSNNTDTISKLLNCFIDGKINLNNEIDVDGCVLRENISILIQCSEFYFQLLYNSNSSLNEIIYRAMRNYMVLRNIVNTEIYSTYHKSNEPIYSVEETDSGDIKLKYYLKDNSALPAQQVPNIVEVETEFFGGKEGTAATVEKNEALNYINNKSQKKAYFSALGINIAATFLIGKWTSGNTGIALSLIWTVISSGLGTTTTSNGEISNKEINKIYEIDTNNVDIFISKFSTNVAYEKDNYSDGNFKYILMPSDKSKNKIHNFLENMKRIRVKYKAENELVKDSLENILGINKDIYTSNKLELSLGGIKMSTDNTNCYRLNSLAEALILKKIKVDGKLQSGITFISKSPGKWTIDGIEIIDKTNSNKKSNEVKKIEVVISDLLDTMINEIIKIPEDRL